MLKLEDIKGENPKQTKLNRLGYEMLQTATWISLSRLTPDQSQQEFKELIFKLLKLTYQVAALTLDSQVADEYFNDTKQKCNVFDAEVRLLTKVNHFSVCVFGGWTNLKSNDIVHILAELWWSHFPVEFKVDMLKEYNAWRTLHQITKDLST